MKHQAKGAFDIRRVGIPPFDAALSPMMSRARFEKRFRGDLDATGVAEMLAVGTPTQGSAAYVAIERVAGHLGGRTGSFFFHHKGTMNRGAASLDLTVVPDSGTDGLAGLSGRMQIDIVDGNHFYTFDYEL